MATSTTRSFARSLSDAVFPQLAETVSPEMYRLGGRLRVIAVAIVTAFDALSLLGLLAMPEASSLAPQTFTTITLARAPLALLDILLSFYVWRGRLSGHGLRCLTIASLALELAQILLFHWALGLFRSYTIILLPVLILVYRAAFDIGMGLVALLGSSVGLLALTMAETTGALPSAPALREQVSGYPRTVAEHWFTLGYTVAMFFSVFAASNWTVVRLRHKERAVLLLRQALVAAGSQQIGRATGRELKETYVLEERLGAGGMGEVYAGVHRRTGRPVAVKLLHEHLLDDEKLLRRFLREAEIAGKIGNPHIVEILDVDIEDNQPFIVMERLVGEDLKQRVERSGPLPLSEVADLISQAAEGLAAAHAAGMVHRDVKPANLFLCQGTKSATVKLLDFGVSRIHGATTMLTHEAALVGTPAFMAPEQATLSRTIDTKVDVFALGAVAYFALTGHPPFGDGSVPRVLLTICSAEPWPVSRARAEVPAAVDAVLAIAMAKRRTERFDTAPELATHLARALCGELDPAVEDRARRVFKALEVRGPTGPKDSERTSRPSTELSQTLAEFHRAPRR